MAYRVPNQDESEELLVAAYRALFRGSNVGAKRSYHRRRAQWLAAALTEIHAHEMSAGEDFMPDTATGSFAERWGRAFGTTKKTASPARREDALLVRGDEGTEVTSGLTLVHEATGLRFKIDSNATIPEAGEVLVDVVAIDTGSRTRLTADEILLIEEVPDGLEADCELQLDLDVDGEDEELESAFKRRYLDVAGEASAGGNNADHKRWMEELAGVDVGYPYANRAGRGTVDVVALRIGRDRALSESERAAVLAALQLLEPSQVGADGGSLRVLVVVEDPQDIELAVRPTGDPAWAMDWIDQTPLVVDDWDPDTNTLTFTTDRPGSLSAGHRCCIHGVASDQDGAVLRVDSLISTNAVKLEAAPVDAPAAGDIVYAAGPLTSIIRDAIIAHLRGDIVYGDDDGPIPGAVAEEQRASGTVDLKPLADPIGPANPNGRYGTWSGGIVRGVIEEFAIYCRGVRSADCIVPATDYEAQDFAFPDDAQIGLVVPGEVLVRRAW
jgi:uncharacterized phage protein gp47/JayE